MLEVGAVLEGKVSGITKFGAFVTLPDGKNGLVHISEISNTYVNEVSEHLQVGQTVKVKVLAINEGKVSLSIKKAEPKPVPARRTDTRPQNRVQNERAVRQADAPTGDAVFEDKLKKFMQESDSRIAGNPMYADRNKQRRKR